MYTRALKMVDEVMETSDSRFSSELRSMRCEQCLLNKSDGSASFSQGDTQVIAATYGPAEVRLSRELIDKATVEVIFRPKVGVPGCAEKLIERVIRNSCEPVVLTTRHPRSSLTIVVQVVQNCGSLLSCAINAACMAMVDAGFPMKCLVCAVTCSMTESGDIHLDPTLEQEKCASAVMTFAFDSVNKNVMTSSTTGSFTFQQYDKCLEACRATAIKLFDFFRMSVERKLSKDAKFMDINMA
ncbi:exosome complex component RRP46-like isoform X1 [Montipora capricornis]|uniref:exosome complex component RRP46-like isoform X1 n=1 Tax=Montipora capricornis TaxID=246305 RepID=UPI0035F17AFD